MENLQPFVIELELHDTKSVVDEHINGSLSVIWRDYDGIVSPPKMIYISSVNPEEIKGPHIHTKRNSYFSCIHGKVVFIIKKPSGEYLEIESNSKKPNMIFVPKDFPSAHVNISSEISRVIALADIAWRPDDKEMINTDFADYDWKKWLKI